MSYLTLAKYGIPAFLIIALCTAVYGLNAKVKALKAENQLITEKNGSLAETVDNLLAAQKMAEKTTAERIKGKDKTIAQLRLICRSTTLPIPTAEGGQPNAADVDAGDLGSVLNSMWR